MAGDFIRALAWFGPREIDGSLNAAFPALEVLADDYDRIVADGMLPGTRESFERLIARCAGIEARANRPESG
ncbi:MAG: hypothetical protein OXN81_03305 [Alphaproteobacteria bacterium]|nr:hypothetical protein [Alphaproteobacteria bacterium]